MRWSIGTVLVFVLLVGAAPPAGAQPFGLTPGAAPYNAPEHVMTLRRAGDQMRLLDGRTVRRWPASAAGPLIVRGTAGNDTLRFDLSGGIPAGGVLFDGGADAGGAGDALEITGGRVKSAVVTFTPDRPGHGHDGRIVLDGTAIEFRDLEPVSFDTPMADIEFVVPQGDGDNLTVLENDAADDPGRSRVRSGADTFETATFVHPTNSFAINLGNDAAESVTISDDSIGLPIAVNGGGGTNVLALADGETLNGGQFDGAGGTADRISYAAYTTGTTVNLGANAGLTATLTPDQEVPATASTASGTATLLYNVTTRTFDVNVSVSGLAPASVSGFHIHTAPVGVNGSIRVDFGAGSLVAAGDGFTFSATNVALPAQFEAALLGGGAYLNVHTAAFASGAIRGQLLPSVSFVDTAGSATGTGGVLNVENVTGGAGADSLVGSNVANDIAAGAGDDTIVPARGADTAGGGANNDLLVWSNGDGSDVLDGDAGSDRVQVNGAAGGTGDEFTLAASGARLDFDRVNPGPFSLDAGGVETLSAVGREDGDSLVVNSLAGAADLTKVELHGFSGNDQLSAAVLPAGVVGQMRGQAGSDSLVAPGGAWQISAPNAGTLAGVMSFDTTESLTTGSGADTFTLADGAALSGTLDAGSGTDTLSFASYTTAVRANLGATATTLSATLGADQEVPATNSTATGTATVAYDAQTGLFTIDVDVDGLDNPTINGFHIHAAPIGVNGSVIVDLMPPGGFPTGNGFTYHAEGVALPALREAALLGGATYVNVHTTAHASGAIRGQLLSSAAFVPTAADATGFGALASIENVAGGAGGDSLVGSSAANAIGGGGGADTIVPAQGADSAAGGADDDLLVWSNGDGSDVLDGDAAGDRVQVNGASAGTGDVFTAGPNGARLAFARTAPGPFTLDIGSVERLAVAGNADGDSLASGDLTGVADLAEVSLHGLAGSDTLAFTTAGPATGLLRGGAGSDALEVNGGPAAGAESFGVTPAADGRVVVTRTTPAAASAAADSSEAVVVDPAAGPDSMTIGELSGVPGLASVTLRGGAGDDVFEVQPSTTVASALEGGPDADSLRFDPGCLAVTQGAVSLAAAGHAPVTFLSVETIGVASAIRFGSSSGSFGEGAGSAAIPITRSGTGSASAQYATSPLTALAGSDYTTAAGTLPFAPGATSGTIDVPLIDDTAIEGNETFSVGLTVPSVFAHVCAPSQFVATITDNDAAVTPPPPAVTPPPAAAPPPAAPPPGPPPPPAAPVRFAITGILPSSLTGNARVTLRLPRRGNVSISARAAGVRVAVARGSALRRGPGSVRVTLRPTATGRRLLRSRGRLRATLTATFRPSAGGAKSTAKRTATLRLRRGR